MANFHSKHTGKEIESFLDLVKDMQDNDTLGKLTRVATDHDQRLVKVEKAAREQADILTKLTAGAETEGSVDNKIYSAVKWGSLDD